MKTRLRGTNLHKKVLHKTLDNSAKLKKISNSWKNVRNIYVQETLLYLVDLEEKGFDTKMYYIKLLYKSYPYNKTSCIF